MQVNSKITLGVLIHKDDIITELQRIGAIKFGQFEIKRDFISPFQLDFSGVLAHPLIAKGVCDALWEKASHFSFDLLCGGSILGACFANYIAWHHDLPMVVHRLEGREMETKIVGSYKSGQTCLVLDDFFLTGIPTLDTIDDLKAEGLEVRDCVALIDFGLGAKKKMKERGYMPHFVFSMHDVLNLLFEKGKLSGDTFKLSTDFLESLHVK